MKTIFKTLFSTPHNDWLGRTLYQINNILVLLFFVLTFLVWGGTGYSAGVMLLLSPLALFIKNRPLQLTKEHYLLMLALILMFASHSFAVFRGNPNFEFSDLDHPMRFILIIPVMLYLMKVGFNQTWFWIGVYAAGLICGWQSITFSSGEFGTRVSGPFNPIIWGDVALVFCLTLAVKAYYIVIDANKAKVPKLMEFTLVLIAIIGAGAGVILSGSRGAWLATLFLISLAIAYSLTKLPLKRNILLISLAIILSLTAYSFTPTIKLRVNQVINELNAFELNSSNRTSTGLRLQMWYTSIKALQLNPIVGVGKFGLTKLEEQLVSEGKVNRWVATKTGQQHSDFFDSMAKNGLIGISILLLFYFSNIKAGLTLTALYSKIIILTTVAYIGFGLTNTIFVGMNGTMFYLVFIIYNLIIGKTPLTSS
ncbi:O-antigen ligase family protein [Reinekea forsetii]|nr:O-antigen ligase family protein [Reinekea forsetii]